MYVLSPEQNSTSDPVRLLINVSPESKRSGDGKRETIFVPYQDLLSREILEIKMQPLRLGTVTFGK